MENNVSVKENVLAGIIGAFLFALVGGVLWFVLYQVGYLAAISGIVGVICAIRGYSFFAKKESVKGIVISVIMAVIVILIAWYACISYDIYTAYQEGYKAGEVDFSFTFFESVRLVPYFLQDTEFLVAYLKDLIIDVKLSLGEKSCTVRALCDTGNMLKEPITGMSVIIVEKQELYSIMPANLLNNIEKLIGGENTDIIDQIEEKEYLTKLRLIPFSSIGKQNGLMLGLKVDEVIIETDEQEKIQDVIIGIFTQTLSKNRTYTALIGLDLLERSKTNEFITNFEK